MKETGIDLPEWHTLIVVLDHPCLLSFEIQHTGGIWILLLDVLYDSPRVLFRGVFALEDSFDRLHVDLLVVRYWVLSTLGIERCKMRKIRVLLRLGWSSV